MDAVATAHRADARAVNRFYDYRTDMSFLRRRYAVKVTSGTVRAVHTHTHTHPFNGPLSGTTQVSRYQKGKTNLDFIEAEVRIG